MLIYNIVLMITIAAGVLVRPQNSLRCRRIYMILVSASIVIVSALRKYTIGRDLKTHYYNNFYNISKMSLKNAFESFEYEKGYIILNKLIGNITSNAQWMIAVQAILILGVTCWFIYRNSEDVVMSMILFITCNAWFMDLTMLRQGDAIVVGLVAVEVWKHKEWRLRRYLLFLVLVIVAASFHSTGIIIILYPILEQLRFGQVHVLVTTFVVIIAFVLYNQVFQAASAFLSLTRDYAEFYSASGYDVTNVSMISLFECGLAILALAVGIWGLVIQREKNIQVRNQPGEYNLLLTDDVLIYMAVLLLICKVLRLRMYIMERMGYYFLPYAWILVPRAIDRLKEEENRMVVKVVLYAIMLSSFLVIGYFKAEELYGTVPFEFFWE